MANLCAADYDRVRSRGIYAGDPRKLSASLILNSLSKNRPPKGYYRGSIAPLGGMGVLINGLVEELRASHAEIHLRSTFKMPEYITTPLVIATNAWNAADILSTSHPQAAELLRQCEAVPLVRATCFFEKTASDLEGFGCLFPTPQQFHSLGVVFNSSIFPDSSKYRSESWILGGALNSAIVAWSDEQVIESILNDRERLTGTRERPLSFPIHRWQRAIPHYTTAWESAVKSLNNRPPLFLHGNYLGQLGLSRILNRSMQLAQEIKAAYG